MTHFTRSFPLAIMGLASLLAFAAPVCARQTPTPPAPKSPPPPAAHPEPTPKVAPQPVDGGDGSTSPVPRTSTLYPGSTVRQFRGKDNFGYRFEGDLRYRSVTGQGENSGTYLSAGRLTGDWVRANPLNRDERGGVRLQALLETDQRGTAIKKIRLSEAYGYYTFLSGGVSARARVGQFVIPFGLLAVYDTPLQPIQTLYEKALGLRVDTGMMLEGRYGDYRYAGSVTTGTGPNRLQLESNSIIAFRLARSVNLPKIGPAEIGGSLLSGKLPRTNFDTVLPPSGTVEAHATVKSTRFAADAQLFRDPWTLRGELVFGGNENNPVFGYYAEGNYRVSRDFAAVAYNRRWDFTNTPSSATALGIGGQYTPPIRLDERFFWTFRVLFEYERNVPESGQDSVQIFHRLTLQTFIRY